MLPRLDSVETVRAPYVTPGGLYKERAEPVIVALSPERREAGLFCPVLFLHAGLEPGDYPLKDGPAVRVTPEMVGDASRVLQDVTLEVASG